MVLAFGGCCSTVVPVISTQSTPPFRAACDSFLAVRSGITVESTLDVHIPIVSRRSMYAVYAYIGVVWGVNVGIYGSPMECLGIVGE